MQLMQLAEKVQGQSMAQVAMSGAGIDCIAILQKCYILLRCILEEMHLRGTHEGKKWKREGCNVALLS